MSLNKNILNRRFNYSHVYWNKKINNHSSYIPVGQRQVDHSDQPRKRKSTDLPIPGERQLFGRPSIQLSPTKQPGPIGNKLQQMKYITVPMQEQTEYMRNHPEFQKKYATTNCVEIVEPESLVKNGDELKEMTQEERTAHFARVARTCGKAVSGAEKKKSCVRKVSSQKQIQSRIKQNLKAFMIKCQ